MADVQIVEVAPRDGLQNEPVLVDTGAKVELIRRLVDAGATRIEATSFVHPSAVPQMADAEAVMAAVPRRDGVRYSGLVLNRKGLDRALDAGCDEVTYVVAATDSFGRRNQNATTAECLQTWHEVSATAHAAGVPAAVIVSTAFGCPFEGEVSQERLAWVCRVVAKADPFELGLADTIGVAVPADIIARVGRACEVAPAVPIRLHLHDTRHTGIANAYAALQAGVRILDASTGGIGGCPFAPQATGNIATEDLLYLLSRSGMSADIDLVALLPTVGWLEKLLGNRVPGMVAKAGPFPPRDG